MTALQKYARLEAVGVWRESDQGQRRDVIVSIGDATLVITDSQEKALAHWSLAAITRVNPGLVPALYHPEGDKTESLELPEDEVAMVEAIETLRRVIDRRRPKPGRLRLGMFLTVLTLIAALVVFWLPKAVIQYAVQVMPEVKRVEIGQSLLNHMSGFTGPPCASNFAQPALRQLSQRLLARSDALLVLPSGLDTTRHLPGSLMLIGRTLVEDYEDPDVLAGYILAEQLRSEQQDSLQSLLSFVGTLNVFRLLTTGKLPEAALTNYAQSLLLTDPHRIDYTDLKTRFAAKGISPIPYAYAVDLTGEQTADLIDHGQTEQFKPSLQDAYWVRLQSLCGG